MFCQYCSRFLLVIVYFHLVSCATNTDFSNFLSQDPYLNYNNRIFPKTTQSDQIVVSMKYSLIAVKKIDETLGQIELAGFVEVTWTNDLLKSWTAAIDEMVISQEKVWRPSIALHNTVDTAKEIGQRSNKIRINKDGTQTWKVGVVSRTSCYIDLSHYPFDKHVCTLEFTPWGYMEDQIKLENSTLDVDLTYYTENVQWRIDQTSLATSNVNGASYLTYSIKIARRPGNTIINYALPVLILSLLSSLAFMMPAESGERIAYSVVTFLTLVIYITSIADNIPRSSSPITILSLFLTLMLLMNALSIAIATLTLRIYAQEDVMAIPMWIKHVVFFLRCRKGKKWCGKKKKSKGSENSSDEFKDDESSLSFDDDEDMDEENIDWDEMEWLHVGYTLDWAFFTLFFITTIVISIFFYFPLAFTET